MRKTFSFLSQNMKTPINALVWFPETKPIAILQIAHGMVEFIERYDDFANYLNTQGILVVGHDHLGHGDSINSEEDRGYFADNASQVLIDDMHTLTLLVKKEYPDLPYFVFGHSMGSFITRYYITQYSHDIDGAILSGTGQNSRLQLHFGKIFARFVSLFRGWNYRSTLIDSLGFGGMNKRIENPRTARDWLSRDEKQVDAYDQDPRSQFVFTLNAYYYLFDICLKAQNNKVIAKTRKDLPLYLIAGDQDPVGKYGEAVIKVYEQFKKQGMEDVEIKLYPGYRHEILNELDNDVVYRDVADWIYHHLKKEIQP